jgi:hypothetical protein
MSAPRRSAPELIRVHRMTWTNYIFAVRLEVHDRFRADQIRVLIQNAFQRGAQSLCA